MSDAIARAFARAKAENRPALVGYLTAYDPDLETSYARILAACEAGLDVLELGVPFSDPTADGPTIQAAMVRAREAGATLDGVLGLAKRLRAATQTPIVLFSYANPLVARGEGLVARGEGLFARGEGLFARCAASGVDGILVVDVPVEASGSLRRQAATAGLAWVSLCAPTSGAERLPVIAASSSAFVYAVSMTGVTGATLEPNNPALVRQLVTLRAATDVPICVGFGVRTAADVAALWETGMVDGVIVGSALVRAAEQSTEALVTKVRELRGQS